MTFSAGLVDRDAEDNSLSHPVVQKLISLDEEYGKIKKEFDDKIAELEREYTLKLDPFAGKRREMLNVADSTNVVGTPALSGFWLRVLENSNEFGEDIEDYDKPILLHLTDIKTADIDSMDSSKGFYVEFYFSPNDYFTNDVLKKTYHTKVSNEFSQEREVDEIVSTQINWNKEKNVTVKLERKAKKRSGGGAKKKNQTKVVTVEKPQDSFFRYFRNFHPDNAEAIVADQQENDEEENDDDESDVDVMETFHIMMEDDWERALGLHTKIVPRAVRWFTGEAVEDDDDDEEDDEETQMSSDGEEDNEESVTDTETGPEPAEKDKPEPAEEKPEKPECKQQ